MTDDAYAERNKTRRLFFDSNKLVLVTVGAMRWLTDLYTLFNVTGLDLAEGVPDGPCKLTGAHGVQPKDIPNYSLPDVGSLMESIEATPNEWLPVSPTLWTVAEDSAKAMLVYSSDGTTRWPLLINEEVWAAFSAYGQVRFEHYAETPNSAFRVMSTDPDEPERIIAYVMGVHMPHVKWGDQKEAPEVAQYIVDEAA